MSGRFTRLVRAIPADCSGIAAVEFALLAPALLIMIAIAVDFGWSYNTKLRIVSAVSAAAQYAFDNGKSVSSSTAATYIANVKTVALAQAGLGTNPTVTVLVNNAADGTNADKYFCLSSASPPTWTQTGTSSSSCGGSLVSGRFVTISIDSTTPAISPWGVGQAIQLSDSAIVRLP